VKHTFSSSVRLQSVVEYILESLSVMLSGAKHLQYLFENKQMQILRCAQDDSPGTFSQPARVPEQLIGTPPAFLLVVSATIKTFSRIRVCIKRHTMANKPSSTSTVDVSSRGFKIFATPLP